MKRNILLAMILSLLGSHPASGARFPNAVEKKVVLSGPQVQSVAELFGLDSAVQSSVKLPLGRMDAWAIYLLKKDTKVELINDNEGSPPRFDVVEYSKGAAPSLTIQPYWLDLATKHPNPEPGNYSFGSPFISSSLEEQDPWTQLVRRLTHEREWKNGERIEFQRSYSFSGGVKLSIEVFSQEDYANKKKGHSVAITVQQKG